MPGTSPEAGNTATVAFSPPEHISIEDLSYAGHLINNAITPISLYVGLLKDDPSVQKDLQENCQELIRRIYLLLKQYEDDLKNMPEFRNFLELLSHLAKTDQFEYIIKLHQMGLLAFRTMKPMERPGRHLSQEMAAVTEGRETVLELKLTVFDHCKNPHGLYIGLSAAQRTKLGVDVDGIVEIFDEKNQSLGVFTVEEGSSEIADHTDLFTANGVEEGAVVTVKKAATATQRGIKPVVLFVDDDEPLRFMFREIAGLMTSNVPIDFLTAGSGEEALAIIENTRDILIAVLTDLGLGEGPNGNVVAKAALDAGIKHVAICTASWPELIHDDIRKRITLIKKPFDIQQLLDFCAQATPQQ